MSIRIFPSTAFRFVYDSEHLNAWAAPENPRVDQEESNILEMKSRALSDLGVCHELIDSTADGDCLYHCFARVLGSRVEKLRCAVAGTLTADDLSIQNAIASADERPHETFKTLAAFKMAVATPGRLLGDDLDLARLADLLPGILIFIADEDTKSITLRARGKPACFITLCRRRLHYMNVKHTDISDSICGPYHVKYMPSDFQQVLSRTKLPT